MTVLIPLGFSKQYWPPVNEGQTFQNHPLKFQSQVSVYPTATPAYCQGSMWLPTNMENLQQGAGE